MAKINKIVIVGGGTSGWATANIMIDRISPKNNTEIVLIESPEIPIIGVGESTTGQMPYTINNINHLGDELEFLKATGSTFKYGIKHSDWAEVGKSFNSPIMPDYFNSTRFPHESYDYLRAYHVAENKSVDSFYHSQCMIYDKVFYVKGEFNNPYPSLISNMGHNFLDTTSYAYHMDAYKTGDYLRKKALETNRMQRVEATVQDVVRDDQGYITGLVIDDGSVVEGDLFIDCSGFKRVLKTEDNEFISYADQLLVNKALIIPKQYEEDFDTVRTYTHAKAMKYGWMFEIPLQERMGRGYNFASQYISEDEAYQELVEALGEEVEVKNTISFEPGRLSRFWDRNVIFVGISSGFMEPLEATTIHITLKEVEHFMEAYYHNNIDLKNTAIKNQFNRDMSYLYDENKDFLVFHYQHTRQDTEFWRDASKPELMSEKLKSNLELWKTRTPRLIDMSDSPLDNYLLLGTVLYYQLCIGMSVLEPQMAKEELEYYDLYDLAAQEFESVKKFGQYTIARSMKAAEFYKKVRLGEIK